MRATLTKGLPKRRFGVLYYLDARSIAWRHHAAHGCTEHLENAIGQAARHVERSLMVDGEYAKALVYDRHEQKVLFIYSRTAEGVMRKDCRKEHRSIPS